MSAQRVINRDNLKLLETFDSSEAHKIELKYSALFEEAEFDHDGDLIVSDNLEK